MAAIKEIAGTMTIVSLFLTVVSGAYMLLDRMDAGLFGYAAMGLVVSLAAYFCIELYQKSKA